MPLPPIILRTLRALEKTLRTYVALDGLATVVSGVVFLAAVDFALDRFFEFSRILRLFLLVALSGSLGFFFWQRFFRRVFVGFRDEQLAMILEHYVPGLNESLITVVEHRDSPDSDAVDAALMRRTIRRATESLQGVRVDRFFRLGRLAVRVATAALIVGIAAGTCAAFSETAELWFSRNVLLSDRDWPRRSRLTVDGFETGRIRIGRGDSFTLTIRADASMPLVPDTICLRLGSKESGYRDLRIDQFQTETTGGIDRRVFSYTFAEMLETIPIRIRGADSTIDGLTIEVVPPPMLTDFRMRQEFPAYLGRGERTVVPSARTTVPDGTSVTITAQSNKPLIGAEVAVNRGEARPIEPSSAAEPFRNVEFRLPTLRENVSVEFLLEDVDRLRNRQPVRLDLSIVKDLIPTVTARLDGIGNLVTPNAVLPVVGEIVDDNALDAARFRYEIRRTSDGEAKSDKNAGENSNEKMKDGASRESAPNGTESASEPKKETGSIPIDGLGTVQTLFSLNQTVSLSEWNVRPGDMLTLHVEASDRFDPDEMKEDEASADRVGLGPQWSLEIVTPERLKSLLEVREIGLRQRFEVLIGEVERTKGLMDEIVLEPTEQQVREAEAQIAVEMSLNAPDGDENERRRLREERETKTNNFLETITPEQSGAGLSNISRSLRDTQKEVYDLRALIESFRQIRLEMVNNRIFSDDVRLRINEGIVVPLQDLVEADFPETDRLIALLDETLSIRDKPLRTRARRQKQDILEHFDRLIVRMQSIRDSMVSMESFNEAIEILRAIIKQQQQLRQETEEQKNRRLRNLLGP